MTILCRGYLVCRVAHSGLVPNLFIHSLLARLLLGMLPMVLLLLSPMDRLCVGFPIACPNAGAWKSPASRSPAFTPTSGYSVEPRYIF